MRFYCASCHFATSYSTQNKTNLSFCLSSTEADDPARGVRQPGRPRQPPGGAPHPHRQPDAGQPPPQPQQHRPHQLHQQTAHRTREGVPLQQVPNPREEDRDRLRPPAQRNASQNLVPEPTDEAEEEDQRGAHCGPRGDPLVLPADRLEREQPRVQLNRWRVSEQYKDFDKCPAHFSVLFL